jgi:hypothetical protein
MFETILTSFVKIDYGQKWIDHRNDKQNRLVSW